MSYARMVGRNRLTGWGYRAIHDDPVSPTISGVDLNAHSSYSKDSCVSRYMIEGEMRRMEDDTFDVDRLHHYATIAGVTDDQAALLLRAFLGIPEPDCEDCNRYFGREHGKLVNLGRCSHKHAVW